jgi:uncharacterized protein (DUF58 family)
LSKFLLHPRWFLSLAIIAILFVLSFFIAFVWYSALLFLAILLVGTVVDCFLLFGKKMPIQAARITNKRWDLGEHNEVVLQLANDSINPLRVNIIDEVPAAFQWRDFSLETQLRGQEEKQLHYRLKPLHRGEFQFGNLNVFISSRLSLLQRRIIIDQKETIKVYPTSQILRNQQINALGQRDSLIGVKKIRKLGHSLEFDQIREYVFGDDVRTINWNATARKAALMVNTFTDIRSQQIYCIIDKGRTMKMPFEGMALVDYAIKATLVFANIAIQKQDKAGLITFSNIVSDIVPAASGGRQMQKILDTLYNQKTDYLDASFEKLFGVIHQKLSQRAFLILFTNFESLASFERQLPYFAHLAKKHLLCVVFFENAAVKEIIAQQPDTIEGIYTKTIAERVNYDKKLMLLALRKLGIIAILTTPEKLTIDVVNNYLELKSRQAI